MMICDVGTEGRRDPDLIVWDDLILGGPLADGRCPCPSCTAVGDEDLFPCPACGLMTFNGISCNRCTFTDRGFCPQCDSCCDYDGRACRQCGYQMSWLQRLRTAGLSAIRAFMSRDH